MNLIEGKVVLITGAAAGIGRGIAEYFGARGAKLYLTDIRQDALEETARLASNEGGTAHAFATDIRDRAALQGFVGDALARDGQIDVLINNAGMYPRREFLEMTEREWDEMQDVNMKSVFHLTQLVLPQMIERKSGKIINISSVTFFWGREHLTHYVASKGAMIGFSRALAREIGPDNVHVNCITPGAVLVEAEAGANTPEQIEALLAIQSLKRRLIPLDVARVCYFLGTELSDGMTGQTLNVDGGRVMH